MALSNVRVVSGEDLEVLASATANALEAPPKMIERASSRELEAFAARQAWTRERAARNEQIGAKVREQATTDALPLDLAGSTTSLRATR